MIVVVCMREWVGQNEGGIQWDHITDTQVTTAPRCHYHHLYGWCYSPISIPQFYHFYSLPLG